ncbi:MAG: hypothetical protein QHH26_05795 [Armatimonadota bacterium]|nr:hypothetical protein [Armatimonadota bacterium]
MFILPQPGQFADIAPFAMVAYWTGTMPETIESHVLQPQSNTDGTRWWRPEDIPEQGGPHIGFEWEEPRRFSKVAVKWLHPDKAPDPSLIKVQYWHRSWPQHGLSGWNAIDDFYNGQWVTAKTSHFCENGETIFSVLPLDREELDRSGIEPVTYRPTLRVRLLFPKGQTPEILYIRVEGDYKWIELPIKIEFGCTNKRIPQSALLEVHNGYGMHGDQYTKPGEGIKLNIKGKVLDMSVLAAEVTLNLPDRTICTLHTDHFSFSFLPLEAVCEPIFIKDFGVFISSGVSFDEWSRSHPQTEKCIYDRVTDEPEQSYERASREIPQLQKTLQTPLPRYVPLGCDGNRQEIAVLYNGDILIDRSALKSKPTEREPLLWPEGEDLLRYRIMTGRAMEKREGENDTKQSVLDGYLPVLISEWETEGISYRQESFAALLEGRQEDETKQRGDETTVLFNKISITNTLDKPATALLWIAMEHPERLELIDSCVMATADLKPHNGKPDIVYDLPRLRLFFNTKGKGNLDITSTAELPSVVRYSVALGPKQSHEVELRVPFITFTSMEWRSRIANPDYANKLRETIDYWKSIINSGTQIETPEPLLNDFIRFQVTHIAITADKDPLTDLTMVPAATYAYGVCANEAMHQVRSLDLRGYYKRAEKYLEPFLKLQGTRNLHGRFKNPAGALHGLRVSEDTDYQTFNYNLDHGFVLWMLCEHYKITRDRKWAERIAPNLIAACDFITRERKATMRTDSHGTKVWEYGLLPPGHLEDPPEFHYWYAVNAYAARGMIEAAEVLKEIKHPEAQRIERDARAFMSDVRQAVRTSMALAPVVRLRDGTSVPFQPTRCLLRGRDWGWIRDALYGPVHLIDCGIYEPKSDEATWILKDTEDNVFISPLYGRRIDDFEKYWFSQGGITIQSNLLPNPLVYLKRGQPEHAIRAFYNSMAANLYQDVRVFCEHPVESYGRGAGPFFKSPDESAFVTWLRHMLVMEDGNTLMIAPGAPRAWFENGKKINCKNLPSYFGPLSFSINSMTNTIEATIKPPKRNPPDTLEVHLRHPTKKQIRLVTVDGKPYENFDAEKGIIRLKAANLPAKIHVVAVY